MSIPLSFHVQLFASQMNAARLKEIAKGEMIQVLLRLTPTIADQIIQKCNTRNRHFRDHKAELWAHRIRTGTYRPNSQGISFDKNGVLNNGQHRTWGCYLAEKSIKIFVCFNENKASQKDLDCPDVRNVPDRLTLGSPGLEWVTSTHASLVSAVLKGFRGSMHYDLDDQEAFLKKHEIEVRHVSALVKKKATKGIGQQCVLAGVFRAWAQRGADQSRITEFVDILHTGVANGQKDSAAIALRDYLRDEKEKNRRKGDKNWTYKYGMTQSALVSFLERRSVKSLRPHLSKEHFPIPEDRYKRKIQSHQKTIQKVKEKLNEAAE